FHAAAAAAGHELGLFEALPGTASALAGRLRVAPRRLRALVRALVRDGALVESEGRLLAGSVPPRRSLPREGWGQLARVIREDRPLGSAGIEGSSGEDLRRFHDRLSASGAAAAAEVAGLLGPRGPLPDLGGGAGVQSRAFR